MGGLCYGVILGGNEFFTLAPFTVSPKLAACLSSFLAFVIHASF